MSKFWAVVTLLLVIGIGLVAIEWLDQPSRISFSDLETECRYDRANSTTIGAEGNRVTFSGHFPTASPEANLDYRYGISDSNSIELDIITRNSTSPESFYDNCLASAVYDAKTEQLESGSYTVTVYHNGVRQERVGVKIN